MQSYSRLRRALLLAVCFLPSVLADEAKDVIATYAFDEGVGTVLHDRSGNGHDGTIVGADWADTEFGRTLRFTGSGSYVDFGDTTALKAAEESTLYAWVRLDASPYPDDTTNWTVLDCENYRQDGFVLRVDGATARTMYRTSAAGEDQYGSGTMALKNGAVHFLALVRQGGDARLYVDGVLDAQFAARPPAPGTGPLRISAAGQSFAGNIFSMTLLKRACDANEVLDRYWKDAGRFHHSRAERGALRVTPHIYDADQEVCAEVNFLGVMPLDPRESVLVVVEGEQLVPETIVPQVVKALPAKGVGFYSFDLRNLRPGSYRLRASLQGGDRTITATAQFEYPTSRQALPSPANAAAPPLAAPPADASLAYEIAPGGGLTVTVDGKRFPVESTYSVPGGGVNRLVCQPARDAGGEPEWKLLASTPGGLLAQGKYYKVERHVSVERGRIRVFDTITNTTAEPQGIMMHHLLSADGAPECRKFIGGKQSGRAVPPRDIKTCPILFAGTAGIGVGLVALDDVFIVQSRGALDAAGNLDLSTAEFALDAGASYTLEWAVYANTTGDYFDVVNALRRDEGRNQVTVQGALAFLQGTQHLRDVSLVPESRYFDLRNAAYATLACLSTCADDPAISVEGIDFTEHPIDKRRITEMMQKLKAVKPDLKGMFHIAHQLYATNRPESLFADSRVLGADGKQAVYEYNYENGSYFSKERVADNWRWWIYYPTLENSFGKAMIDSVDVMMDELGCKGVFADGFLWGYGGAYTYDRWDGHSADIDPATQKIARKKGSVLLLTQDAMIAWSKKIAEKGGVVIANGVVPTRTICAQPILMDKEVTEGPDVPLLTTPVTLGDPSICGDEQGIYDDVLNKLRWGNLYFYYNELKDLSHASLPQRMYPITVQEVHAGCVIGKERIVTMNSGVYGWQGSRALHIVYKYDSRGHQVPADSMTTADRDSVRTEVKLEEHESAVIEQIPVTIECDQPCNVEVIDESFRYQVYTFGLGKIVMKGTMSRVEMDGSSGLGSTSISKPNSCANSITASTASGN